MNQGQDRCSFGLHELRLAITVEADSYTYASSISAASLSPGLNDDARVSYLETCSSICDNMSASGACPLTPVEPVQRCLLKITLAPSHLVTAGFQT